MDGCSTIRATSIAPTQKTHSRLTVRALVEVEGGFRGFATLGLIGMLGWLEPRNILKRKESQLRPLYVALAASMSFAASINVEQF